MKQKIYKGGSTSIIKRNSDNFGFLNTNISSADLDGCHCITDTTPDFFRLAKVYKISSDKTSFEFGTIGTAKNEIVYTNSYFMPDNQVQALMDGENYGSNKIITDAFNKYIKWLIYYYVSVSTLAVITGKTNIKTRMLFDATSWVNLNRISGLHPFRALAIRIIEIDMYDYPRQYESDNTIVDNIRYVLTTFLSLSTEDFTVAEQFALLLHCCANLPYQQMMRVKTVDRFELLLYEFPSKFSSVDSEGLTTHGTHAFIGQVVRFLSFIQVPYIEDGTQIHIPQVVHIRDAHACCLNLHSIQFDSYWESTNNRYLCGTSILYERPWHKQRKGNYAGFVSAKRDLEETYIQPPSQFKHVWGRAFCVTATGTKTCPTWDPVEYSYGLDEYAGSYMYLDSALRTGAEEGAPVYLKEVYDNTLYVQIVWYHHMISTDVRYIIEDEYYTLDANVMAQRLRDIYTAARGVDLFKDANFDICTPVVQILWWQLAAIHKLVFNFFAAILLLKDPDTAPTWNDINTKMYYIINQYKQLIDMNLSDDEEHKHLLALIPSNSVTAVADIRVLRFYILIAPPCTAFFNGLFNNSENVAAHGTNVFTLIAPVEDICSLAQRFYGLVFNPTPNKHSVLVNIYKKIYNVYSKDGPCVKWDMRSVYTRNELGICSWDTKTNKTLVYTPISN
jgi:hypothetical protein